MTSQTNPRRAELLASLASYDDGTDTLGVIVDHALIGDPDVTVDEVRVVVVILEAIEDARIERARENAPAPGAALTGAQLYWDDQDPANAGWCLRWTDEDGDQSAVEICEDEDADMVALASRAATSAPSGATGDVTVYRGDRKSARITLCDGALVDWRAL